MNISEQPPKKLATEVPDRRLAHAFNFTHYDLNANRAGYLSRGQLWGAPPFLRRILGKLGAWIPPYIARRPRVRTACGRASLVHERREILGFFRVDFVEFFAVQLGEAGMRFPLNQRQYNALAEGLFYQIYYDEYNVHIHAIERVFNQCKDS